MTENPKVCVITATKNRHEHLERSVRFFLDQDYLNSCQLIYNNSTVDQRLNTNLDPDRVILVNQHIDSTTGQPYTTLGGIYNDAIKYIPEDVEIVGFMDDDDIFLPNHISEGVKGLIRGGKTAYKPERSLFKNGADITPAINTFEPSIFIKKEHILKYGFSLETSAQHLKWVDPLVWGGEIYVDPDGPSTLIYCWGNDIPTFKTSGNSQHPENFKNYETFSQDVGDRIITPINKEKAKEFYRTS